MADSDVAALEAVKIACLSGGVRITESALRALGGADRVTVHEYATTGGVGFILDADVCVNAPFDDWYCEQSSVVFDLSSDGSFFVSYRGVEYAVQRVLPLPGYLGVLDGAGHRVDSVAMSHFDRVRLSPLVGCAYDCSFCDLPGRIARRGLDRLLPALEIAAADRVLPVRHLLISGGSPGRRDLPWFEEVCSGVARHAVEIGLEVDVMMSAQPDIIRTIDRLVDAGVTGFALNVELFEDAASESLIHQKHKRSRPFLERGIRHAVDILGRSGRVRSLIIPGLEPTQSTIEGIDFLASLGCDPVISPFRPARGTKLSARSPSDPGELSDVLAAARESVVKHGVALGPRCVPCQHNTLAFPWDVRNADATDRMETSP